MRNLRGWVLIYFLSITVAFNSKAQAPNEPAYNSAFTIANDLEPQQTSTGVVIIDDDELGITISPNPASSYITISSSKDLSNKSFFLYNSMGVLSIQQRLSNTTIDLSRLNNGTYSWIITDQLNKKLAWGSLVVQK